MTPQVRFTVLDVPAGSIRILRPPEGDKATASSALRVRHPVHQTALLDLTVILIYVATAAAALLSGRLGHEPVLTAKGSPLNAVAAPPSPAATAQIVAAYTAFFPALTAAEPQSQARAAAILARHFDIGELIDALTRLAAGDGA